MTFEEELASHGGFIFTNEGTSMLPLIRPAMGSGFFLIFLPAMREVTTSILLYGPYTRTLGVQIYSLRDAGMIPQAAAGAKALRCLYSTRKEVRYEETDRRHNRSCRFRQDHSCRGYAVPHRRDTQGRKS